MFSRLRLTILGLLTGLTYLSSLASDPVVVFYNNSDSPVRIAFIREGTPVVMATLQSKERFRSGTGVGDLWGIYGSNNQPIKSYKGTAEAMQVVYVKTPASPEDVQNAEMLEQEYQRNLVVEAQRAAAAEKARKEAEAQFTITGLFKMGDIVYFLQESDHQGSEPAKWSVRQEGDLGTAGQEFREISRDASGVMLTAGGDSQVSITKAEVRIRASERDTWQLMGRGEWIDRKPMLTKIRELKADQQAEQEKANKEAELERMRVAAEQARQEQINNAPPTFRVTNAFRTSAGIFVRVRPNLWEYWGYEDFDMTGVEQYRELSRNVEGLTIQSNRGVTIRIHEDYWEFKMPGDEEFKMTETDDVVGTWEPSYRSVADIRTERDEWIQEESDREAERLKAYRGANPDVIDTLKSEPEYLAWVSANQEGVRQNEVYYDDYRDLELDRFYGIGFLQEGYNIIYMDPGRLLRNGTGKLNLFNFDAKVQKAYESFDSINVLPAALSAISTRETLSTISSQNFMTGFQHAQSESFSVSVGVDVAGKGGGDVGYGSSTEKINAEQLNSRFTRHETRGYITEYIINKEHLILHDTFRKRIMGAIRGERGQELATYNQFKTFFLDFGTHYALRTMTGGMIWQESKISEQYMMDQVTNTSDVSAGIKIPIKAVNLGIESKTSKSDSQQNESRVGSEETSMWQFGSNASAEYDEWSLDYEDTQLHEPMRVELQPIFDLLQPTLFPVQTFEEVAQIRNLRSLMERMLRDYINNETRGRPTIPYAEPYAIELKVDSVKCVEADDSEFATNGIPDVYGSISLWHNDIERKTVWSKDESSYIEMNTGDTLQLDNPTYRTVITPRYVQNQDGTYRVQYPETTLSVLYSLWDNDGLGGNSKIDVRTHTFHLDRDTGQIKDYAVMTYEIDQPGAGKFNVTVSALLYPVSLEQGKVMEPAPWFHERMRARQ